MTNQPDRHLSYAEAGVDTDAAARGLAALLGWVRRTEAYRTGLGAPLVPNGFFANVLGMTDRLSLAISTDGVGSKSAVAQLAGRYESIGWDAVAVNVNDVVCVGAEPAALVDYISLQAPHPDLLEQLGKGMHDAAQRAGVAIVGGELSQHPDTLTGPRPGYAFDISGTCVGTLEGRAPITGAGIRPGDAILGLPSNGIHANGLTLARRVLLEGEGAVDAVLPECGRTVGEELLRPTHVYVPEALALLRAGVEVRGLAHISGDGLLNLTRFDADVTYRFDALEEPGGVFGVIAERGGVDAAEMWRVFNMGIGFCVVVAPEQVDRAQEAIASMGGASSVIGQVRAQTGRRVELVAQRLVGQDGRFSA